MARGVYKKFQDQELTLRDHLAIDRTVLANERTFLAYVRTALALILTGVSLIKFTRSPAYSAAAWFVLIPAGVFTVISGFVRYQKMKVSFPRKN